MEIRLSKKNYHDIIKDLGGKLEFEKLALKVAKALNTKIIKYLASGKYGSAFLTSSDHVIKITDDQGEAMNAFDIMRNPKKGFVRYYRVYQLEIDELNYKIFVLVMEKIQMLSRVEEELQYCLRALFYAQDDQYEDMTTVGWNSYRTFIRTYNEDLLKKTWNKLQRKIKSGNPNLKFWGEPIDLKRLSTITYEEFYEMYDSLNQIIKSGIELDLVLNDMHSRNMGYNMRGELVLFDIGTDTNKHHKLPYLKL